MSALLINPSKTAGDHAALGKCALFEAVEFDAIKEQHMRFL